jgi:bromodomain adjacent to zinc finger domain protein 1A
MSILNGDKEGTPKPGTGTPATDGASSDSLSDVEDSEAGSSNGKTNGKSKDLRKKAAATERQVARAKAKDAKQATAELRRIEEEVAKIDRRLEGIERDFRRNLGVARIKPLGKDRFYNRIWWFDGLGSANLIGSGGTIMYGTGRIFVQGPSEFDIELLDRREKEEKDVVDRRPIEEGEDGVLGVGEWAVYESVDQVSIVHYQIRH